MTELRRPYIPPPCREYVAELEDRLRRLRALRYKQSDVWLAGQIDKLTDGVPEESPKSGCARVHAQLDAEPPTGTPEAVAKSLEAQGLQDRDSTRRAVYSHERELSDPRG